MTEFYPRPTLQEPVSITLVRAGKQPRRDRMPAPKCRDKFMALRWVSDMPGGWAAGRHRRRRRRHWRRRLPGLYLIGRVYGNDARDAVARSIEYDRAFEANKAVLGHMVDGPPRP